MHEKFFEIARSNMVKNQILPNNVKGRELIDALLEIKKELFGRSGFQEYLQH